MPKNAVPVGLWYDGYAIARSFECTSNDSSAERGMVDVGVARKEDDVDVVPSP